MNELPALLELHPSKTAPHSELPHSDKALVLGLDHDGCASTFMANFEETHSRGWVPTVKAQWPKLLRIIEKMVPDTAREDITIYIYSFSHRQTPEIENMLSENAQLPGRNETLLKWAVHLCSAKFKTKTYTGWDKDMIPDEYAKITNKAELTDMPKGSIWAKLHAAHPHLPMILIDDKIKMLNSAAEAAAKVDPNNMPKLLHFNKYAQGAIEELTYSFD